MRTLRSSATPFPGVSAVRRSLRRAGLVASALTVLSCSGDTFDSAQVPQITVSPVIALPVVRIAWTPSGAQLVRVYRGTSAGQGLSEDLMWSVTASGPNSIASGLEYGNSMPSGGAIEYAAKPLVLGQPYTVQVSRLDPARKTTVLSAAPRYVNTQVFTINSLVPNP